MADPPYVTPDRPTRPSGPAGSSSSARSWSWGKGEVHRKGRGASQTPGPSVGAKRSLNFIEAEPLQIGPERGQDAADASTQGQGSQDTSIILELHRDKDTLQQLVLMLEQDLPNVQGLHLTGPAVFDLDTPWTTTPSRGHEKLTTSASEIELFCSVFSNLKEVLLSTSTPSCNSLKEVIIDFTPTHTAMTRVARLCREAAACAILAWLSGSQITRIELRGLALGSDFLCSYCSGFLLSQKISVLDFSVVLVSVCYTVVPYYCTSMWILFSFSLR